MPRTLTHLPSRILLPRFLSATTATATATTVRSATAATSPSRAGVAEALVKLSRWGYAKEGHVLLARQGLEEMDGGVRIGVFANGDGLGRVASALLDPLHGEGGGGDIRSWCSGGRGALLLRHGPRSGISKATNSPVSHATVPSSMLRSLEILLARIPTGDDPTDVTLDAGGVPGARFLEYPVHKAVVLAGEGEAGLRELLKHNYDDDSRVLRLLSLPGFSLEEGGRSQAESVKIVDLPAAEGAVTLDREWWKSGFDGVWEWVLDGCAKPEGGGVRPAVKTLVASIAAESERVIDREEERLRHAEGERARGKYEALPAADGPESLSESLKDWAESAHSELQTSLMEGFNTRAWKHLAWWKLIWTADDVAANAKDIVGAWLLPRSKRAFLFLAGRLAGAGFTGTPAPTSPEQELAQLRLSDESSGRPVDEHTHTPYPPHLFNTDHVSSTLVLDLQDSANRLLLGSMSFSLTSAAASGLLYLSDVPLYSSSSVAALGIALGARWLQTRWGREQTRFQKAVWEHGRVAIVESERWAWRRLQQGASKEGVTGKDAELERVLEGRAVVGRVRELLGGL